MGPLASVRISRCLRRSAAAGLLPLLRLLDHVAVFAEDGGHALAGLGLEVLHLLLLYVGELSRIAERGGDS